jgi:hypothetical protein
MTLSVDGLATYFKNVAKAIDAKASAVGLRAAVFAAGIINETVSDLFPSGRTGQLQRSFKGSLVTDARGLNIQAKAVSKLVYAETQDVGNTIYPKTRKNLAVPFPGRLHPVGKWPRHFAKGQLSFISRRGKSPLLARIDGGLMRPMFVLKKSVRIRGKQYLKEAERRMDPELQDLVGDVTYETFGETP